MPRGAPSPHTSPLHHPELAGPSYRVSVAASLQAGLRPSLALGIYATSPLSPPRGPGWGSSSYILCTRVLPAASPILGEVRMPPHHLTEDVVTLTWDVPF